MITITQTDQPCPAGFQCYSPVYAFGPPGTTFQKPVTVSIPFAGNQQLATLFWSFPTATGYQRVGGLPQGAEVAGDVTHFSTGFIADGVDYSQPADLSCVRALGISGRYSGESASDVCFSNCSSGGCQLACPRGVEAGVGCVSNCSDGGCQMGCPLEGLAEGNGIYPMVGSDGGGGPVSLGSAVALFFNVQDCEGRSATRLDAGAFTVLENGNPLSVEAQTTILPKNGIAPFVELVLDVSSHTNALRSQMFAGAENFVQQLQVTDHLPAAIGIETFAGEQQITEQLAPTLDTSVLMAKLQSLAKFVDPDPNSTNLYGAVIQSLAALDQAEQNFVYQNAGGAFAAGFAVLFTDGLDTSGYYTQGQAVTAENSDFNNQVIAVALQDSSDYNLAALNALTYGGQTLINSPNPMVAESREFPYLATYVSGELSGSYLLGYCSPRRAGASNVTVEVANTTNAVTANLVFNTDGFGPGCGAAAFATACDGWQCGGLGCGSCNETTSYCSGPDGGAPDGAPAVNQCEVCQVGGTAPTKLADIGSGPSGIGGLALDSTNIYWTQASTVMSVPLGGGTPTPLASDQSPSAPRYSGIAVDQNNAYWTASVFSTNNWAVMSVPLGGGTPSTLGSGIDPSVGFGASGIAVDATSVYWSYVFGLPLLRIPLGGGAETGIAPGTSNGGIGANNLDGSTIVVRGSNVYWVDVNGIMTAPIAGGTATTLVAGMQPDNIAVDANNVYWGGSGTTVMSVPVGGGTPKTLVSGQNAPNWVAVDATNIYWLNYLSGTGCGATVMKAPIGGGTPTQLAWGQESPTNILVDSSSVYWFSISRAALFSVPK
ncbi:MAG TPA: hypothetical protein VKU41_30165 [Polyangiaceae bacterium]|nr:hypothetical protein [Polyangiaceae bacterium]